MSRSLSLPLLLRSVEDALLWVVGAAGSRATKEGVDGLREEPTEEDLRIRKLQEWLCLKGLLPPAELVRLEAVQGNSRGLLDLARTFVPHGGGQARDQDEALRLLQKAARLGEPEALCLLGKEYQKMAADAQQACCAPRQSADARADLVRAANLFYCASALDHPEATRLLGCCHLSGAGVPHQDVTLARTYFETAVQLGDPLAAGLLLACDSPLAGPTSPASDGAGTPPCGPQGPCAARTSAASHPTVTPQVGLIRQFRV